MSELKGYKRYEIILCPDCEGKGYHLGYGGLDPMTSKPMTYKDPCKTCDGEGRLMKIEELRFEVLDEKTTI